MNKFTLFIFSLSTLPLALHAQSNCNNHVQVTICPTTTILNETNSGMGDDAPIGANITGEDVLYEIIAPNGAQNIFISISNATGPSFLSIGNNLCNVGPFTTYYLPQGNSNVALHVATSPLYFLWIDAASTITYDISFGADTGNAYVSIPNTQGNLQFDGSGCATPLFQLTKPYFQVSYNNVFKTHPLTLSPLSVQGTMCVNTFFKNTTGIEGVKKFQFEFDTLGFSGFNTTASTPGMFLPGNWIADKVGNKIIMTFVDALGTGKGDFAGTPNSCLNYHFCFDVIPISNDPQKTNVKVKIYSDGFGYGYTGNINLGCCPGPLPNCLGSGPGSGSGTHAFAYSFNDPGNPLPIELIDFNAKANKEVVDISWTTASEINNEFFTVEKSNDVENWKNIRDIEGAGNSTTLISYLIVDEHPFPGLSYYRLKQTDIDGNYSYSTMREVHMNDFKKIKIYPNPVVEQLTIESEEMSSLKISLLDMMNKLTPALTINGSDQSTINTSKLPAGIYYLIIERDNLILTKEKIIIQK